MAESRAVINIDVNTSDAAASLRQLQAQINAFNSTLSKTSAVQSTAIRNSKENLLELVNASRFFSAETVKMQTAAGALDKTLSKGQVTLGQFFSAKFKKDSLAASQLMSLAETRAAALQTQFVATGAAANGMREAIAIRPLQAFNNASVVSAQKLAIQRAMLQQATTSMINFGKNTQWAGRQLMVGFTVPLTIFAGVAGKAFMDLEKQAVNFKKVYGDSFTPPGEMEQNLEAVKGLAKEFTKYGIAVKDTIGLAAQAAAAGAQNKDLIDATTQATRLATLGQMEQNQALETTIALQNAFGLSGDNLAKSINFLNMVENQTVVTLQDLAAAIPRVAPVIKGLGGSVEDMAAMLAAMQEGGVSAEQGANALKSGLASLINPTNKAVESLKEMGISLDKIVQTNRGDLMGTVQDFARALSTLDNFTRQQALEQVFGKFQYARLGALFNNIIKDGSQASRVMETATLSAENLAQSADKELGAIEESPATKFTAAMEKLQLAIAPIGEMFTKMAIPVVNFFVDVLEKFNDLPDMAKKFVGIGSVLVGIVIPAGTMFLGLLMNLVGTLIKFGSILGIAFKGFISGGFRGAIQGVNESLKYMSLAEIDATLAAQQLAGTTNAVNSALLSQVGASESAGAAIRELSFAYEILTQQMSEAAAMNSMVFGTGATAMGKAAGTTGPRVRRNRGGTIPGSGNTDTVPAMLTPGEFVVNKDATQKNLPLLRAINDGTMQGFAGGGLAAMQMVAKNLKPLAVQVAAARTVSATRVNNSFRTMAETVSRAVKWKRGGEQFWRHEKIQSLLQDVPAKELGALVLGMPKNVNQRMRPGQSGLTGNQIINELNSLGYSANDIFDPLSLQLKSYNGKNAGSTLSLNNQDAYQELLGILRTKGNNVIFDPDFEQIIRKEVLPKVIKGSAQDIADFTAKIIAPRHLKTARPSQFANNEEFGNWLLSRGHDIEMKKAGGTTRIYARNPIKGNLVDITPNSELGFYTDLNDGILDYTEVRDAINKYRQQSGLPSFAAGMSGQFTHANSGGYIVPGQGNKDTVPAMLTPGEFVVNKKATKDNLGLLSAINGGNITGMNAGGLFRGYEAGDLVGEGNLWYVEESNGNLKEFNNEKDAQKFAAKTKIKTAKRTQRRTSRNPMAGRSMGVGMGMGAIGGAMMMAPAVIPGLSENQGLSSALSVGGTALSVASMLPMMGPMGAAIAAIAAVPVTLFAFDKHMKSVTEEARKLGDAVSVSAELVQGTAEAFGRQLLVDRQKEQTRKQETGVTTKEAEIATQYLAQDAGKALKEETELALAKLGSGPAMKGLAQKMSSMILAGAVNPKQAKAIVAVLGQEIGNEQFSIDVIAKINDMVGQNGKSVRNNPYLVAVDIITNQSQVEQTLSDSLGKAVEKASDIGQLGGFFTQQVSKEGFFSSDSLGALTANIIGFGTTTTTAFQDIAYVSDIAKNVLGFFNQDFEVAIAQSQTFGKVVGNNVRNSYDVLNSTIERNRQLLKAANKEERPEMKARFLREEEDLRKRILETSRDQAKAFAGYGEGFQAEILKGVGEASRQLYENDPTMKAIVDSVLMRTGALDKTLRFNIETSISSGMLNPSTVQYFLDQFATDAEASKVLNVMIQSQGLDATNEQLLKILNIQDETLRKEAIINLIVNTQTTGDTPETLGTTPEGVALKKAQENYGENQTRVNRLRFDIEGYNSEISMLKGELDDLQARKNAAEKDGNKAEADSLQEDINRKQSYIDELVNQRQSVQNEINQLRKELTDAERAYQASLPKNYIEGTRRRGRSAAAEFGTSAERSQATTEFLAQVDAAQRGDNAIKIRIDYEGLSIGELQDTNKNLEIFNKLPKESMKIAGVTSVGSPEELAAITEKYVGLESTRESVVKNVVMNVLGSQGVSAETAIGQIQKMGYSMEQFAKLDNVTKYNILYNLEIQAKLKADIQDLGSWVEGQVGSPDRMEASLGRLAEAKNQLKEIQSLLKGLQSTADSGPSGTTPKDTSGSGGAAEKTINEQLKEAADLAAGFSKVFAGKRGDTFLAKPFGPEFLQYLRSQGQKGLDLLKGNFKQLNQAYKDYEREQKSQSLMVLQFMPGELKKQLDVQKASLNLTERISKQYGVQGDVAAEIVNQFDDRQKIELQTLLSSGKISTSTSETAQKYREIVAASTELAQWNRENANYMKYMAMSAEDQVSEYFSLQNSINDIRRQLDEIRIIAPLEKELKAQEALDEKLSRSIELKQRESDVISRNIELEQRKLEPLDEQSQKLEDQLDSIDEIYQNQIDALDTIYEKENNIISLREKSLDIAGALSRGDVAAAAKAQIEMQKEIANQRQQDERSMLEAQRDAQKESVNTEINNIKKSREQIEKNIAEFERQQRDIEDDIYDLQQDRIPIQNEIYRIQQSINAESAKLESIYGNSALKVAELETQLRKAEKAAQDLARAMAATGTAAPAASAGGGVGGLPPASSYQTGSYMNATQSASVASQFSPQVLANAARLNQAAASGQDVTKLGFTKSDWSNLAALEAANKAAGLMYGGKIVKYAMGGMINYRGSREQAPGMAFGGKMRKYAVGNYVNGYGMTDKVPALLTPGEFVVKKSVTSQYRPLLEALNGQVFPKMNMGKAMPNSSAQVSSSMYNINVTLNGSDMNPDDVANVVMRKIKMAENTKVRGYNIRG